MTASLAKRNLQVNTGLMGNGFDDDPQRRSLSPVGGGMNFEMQDVKVSRLESNSKNGNEGRISTSSLIERADSAESSNTKSPRGKRSDRKASDKISVKSSSNTPVSQQRNSQLGNGTSSDVSETFSLNAFSPKSDDSRLSTDLDLPVSDESPDSSHFGEKSPKPTFSAEDANEDDYYCVDHMKLCSKEEAAEEHGNCEYLVPAFEWAEAQTMEKDRRNTEAQLKRIDTFAGTMIDERNSLKQQLVDSKEDITDEFMDIVEELIADLLAKQKTFMSQLDELHEGQLKIINDQIKRCKKVQTETSESIQQLDTSVPGSEDFRKLKKKIQDKCPVYEEILRRDFNSATRLDYEFQPDPWVNEVFAGLTTIGKVVTRPTQSRLPGFLSESTERDFSKRDLFVETKNDGSSVKDKNSSCFTGCTFVAGSCMILTDWNNNSLKLFNKRGLLVDRLEFKNNPWDVKMIDDNRVVVTIPGAQKVALVKYSPQSMVVESTFDTDCECWGVTPVKDKLAMTCDPWSKTPSVKVYTYEGKLVSFYQKDGDQRPLFSYPEHITTDIDHEILYVSDSRSNEVLAITITGLLLFRYRNRNLSNPAGVATDNQGFIYVNGKDSQNVHQITKEGEFSKILMDKIELENPRGLCFEPEGDRLIITDVGSTNCEEFMVAILK